MGANNSCVAKPFHYPELEARVAAVLRRRNDRREGPIRVGDLLVDAATRRVTVGDREVSLANKEFVLLRTLASDPRRVFTKEELLRDVWGDRLARLDIDVTALGRIGSLVLTMKEQR